MAILYLAITLLALASPLVKWLIVEGPNLGLEREAISFCNVLFVGNLLGGIVSAVTFGPRKIQADLKQASRGTWGLLFVNVLLAAAIPTLIFTALASTTITNLILIGRFESVAFAVLAALFGVSALTKSQAAGYAIISVGVIALVLVIGMGSLKAGDYMILCAALLQAVAALLVRRLLNGLHWGTFVFARNFFSAIVFFTIAVLHFGPIHFADAFGGKLWMVMLVYAFVVVVIGQAAWYSALEKCTPSQVASASLLTPFLAVGFAYLLLGEVPQKEHWIGGSIIVAGMVLVYRGGRGSKETAVQPTGCAESTLAGA